MCSSWYNNWVIRQHTRCNNENRNTFLVSPCVLQRIDHLVLVGLLTPQYNGTSATGWFIWVFALTLNLHWCSRTSLTWIEQSWLSLMKSYMQWIECIVACITPPKAPELSARAAYGASNADQLRKRANMCLNSSFAFKNCNRSQYIQLIEGQHTPVQRRLLALRRI